jgi:hypothetical protein
MKNRILSKGKTACAVVAAVAGLMAGVAGEASASMINYNISSTQDTTSTNSRIWSKGGTAAIEGTGIRVANVMGIVTPGNSGTHSINQGILQFNSGMYNPNTGMYENGTFSILGKLSPADTVTTLLSGIIDSLVVDRSNSSEYKISKAKLSVTDNALATYFGFNSSTKFAGLMDLNFNVLPAGFEGATNNGTISTSTVPLPAAIWLFASGAAGLFGMRRRQLTC